MVAELVRSRFSCVCFAMVKNSSATFKPVSFQRGKVHISGGLLGKYMAMTTKDVKDLDGKSYEFVKVTCGEPWLVHNVSGCSWFAHSAMSRTTLVADLLKQVVRICNGDDDPDVQLHGGGAAGADVGRVHHALPIRQSSTAPCEGHR